MGAKVYKPDQIKELNFDCLIVCILNHNNEILRTCINEKVDLEKVLFVKIEMSSKTRMKNLHISY